MSTCHRSIKSGAPSSHSKVTRASPGQGGPSGGPASKAHSPTSASRRSRAPVLTDLLIAPPFAESPVSTSKSGLTHRDLQALLTALSLADSDPDLVEAGIAVVAVHCLGLSPGAELVPRLATRADPYDGLETVPRKDPRVVSRRPPARCSKPLVDGGLPCFVRAGPV